MAAAIGVPAPLSILARRRGSLRAGVPEVSIMAVRGLAAAVERFGLDRERFLSEAGVPLSLVDDLHARMSLAAYQRVVRVALVFTGDPALGLHLAERVSSASFDALGHLTEHCSNLREALQMAMRYASIVTDGPQMLTFEDAATDSLTVRLTFTNTDTPEVRLAAEFSMFALLRLVRHYSGDSALPRRVCFAYAAPEYHAEYARVFAGCERFSQEYNCMVLDRSWLDRPQRYRSPELQALLQARTEVLLARVEFDAPATQRVKRWLSARQASERPNMEHVARGLGMSARSLRRRLQEESTRFDDLVDEELAGRAKRLLSDPRASVQAVAFAMSFRSASAFSRAFKRWTGTAPRSSRGPKAARLS